MSARRFPGFLSIILVVRDQGAALRPMLASLSTLADSLAEDYEIVLVDNASRDDTVARLKELTSLDGLPNLQAHALAKAVDADTAAWAGLERALGDLMVVMDPRLDDPAFLPSMLDHAVRGADVVFARNEQAPPESLAYRLAYAVFNRLYRHFNGVDLRRDAPDYRMLSRRVVNFILQHPQPALAYRHLPASGGFARANLSYNSPLRAAPRKTLEDRVDRGLRLLVSTTRAPMRLVTTLCLFGAGANILYSLYVIAIFLFKADVAPGWVTLSLQQSGMFLLLSLVLLVLGEYVLQMASLAGDRALYHVVQEFTSARMTRREKLNVEESPSDSLPRVA